MNFLTASIQELIDYQKLVRKQADELFVNGEIIDKEKYRGYIEEIRCLEDTISSKICNKESIKWAL